jgi:hypothetical protein
MVPHLAQHFRDLAIDDLLGQALGNGGLADAGLAHQQGVVLAPPAQDLDGALDLVGGRSAGRSCPGAPAR